MSSSINSLHQQQGTALIVGLVVLLVMTMLGVASMGSMTTELRIANNTQTHQVAFQAAASAIQAVLNDPAIEWNDTAGGVGNDIASQPAAYVSPNGDQSADLVVRYSGCRKVFTGSSLTSDGMGALAHEIEATGQARDGSSNVIATSKQVLGVQTTMVAGC